MTTAATIQVTVHLPQSEVERIVNAAEWMLRDGVAVDEVKRWAKAEVGKAVTVR